MVVITDTLHRNVLFNLTKGMSVQFCAPDGRLVSSALEGIELFGSPFNPNKPFMFVVNASTAKADIPIGSDIKFEAQ